MLQTAVGLPGDLEAAHSAIQTAMEQMESQAQLRDGAAQQAAQASADQLQALTDMHAAQQAVLCQLHEQQLQELKIDLSASQLQSEVLQRTLQQAQTASEAASQQVTVLHAQQVTCSALCPRVMPSPELTRLWCADCRPHKSAQPAAGPTSDDSLIACRS